MNKPLVNCLHRLGHVGQLLADDVLGLKTDYHAAHLLIHRPAEIGQLNVSFLVAPQPGPEIGQGLLDDLFLLAGRRALRSGCKR